MIRTSAMPSLLAAVLLAAVLPTAGGCGWLWGGPKGIGMQLTTNPKGHFLHNTQCWSPDDQWIVYDNRHRETMIASTGSIEKVNTDTGQIVPMYVMTTKQTKYGPGVGAATWSPTADRILFIHGILNCDEYRPYGVRRRTGVAVDGARRGKAIFIDARDVTPPFTPGALRGGTHAHTWSADGKWISFTYQDMILGDLEKTSGKANLDLRTVGVSAPLRNVKVDKDPDRENNDGQMFSVLVVKVVSKAKPGSDEIERAFSDSWVGVDGYVRSDGTRQKRAIAFQGHVRDKADNTISEVFIVDVPDKIDTPGPDGPLEGTATQRPMPPAGTVQRRLTFTAGRKHPGIQGPRHWLRTSPDGSKIAFLAKDDDGVVQIFFVSPLGGPVRQVTDNDWSVATPFNWSPDGTAIAYGMDNSIFITDVREGETFGTSKRMTKRSDDDKPAPLPYGVVWSHDGKTIAYNRAVPNEERGGRRYLQIFLLKLE